MVANNRIVNPNGGTDLERRAVLAFSVLGALLVLYQLNILYAVYIVTRYIVLGIVALVLVVDCCCFRPKTPRVASHP